MPMRDSRQNLQVLIEGAEHEKWLAGLQCAQILEECLHLGDEKLAELLFVRKWLR